MLMWHSLEHLHIEILCTVRDSKDYNYYNTQPYAIACFHVPHITICSFHAFNSCQNILNLQAFKAFSPSTTSKLLIRSNMSSLSRSFVSSNGKLGLPTKGGRSSIFFIYKGYGLSIWCGPLWSFRISSRGWVGAIPLTSKTLFETTTILQISDNWLVEVGISLMPWYWYLNMTLLCFWLESNLTYIFHIEMNLHANIF